MRIVSVVGARPQFIKIAPVSRRIADQNSAGGTRIEDLVVHTGQHYDPKMSQVFFEELHIAKPDINLAVGSGSHGEQTAFMLEKIEAYLVEQQPDCVVVYGDTNSTIAGALAAVKLGMPVVHVEAGLRSFKSKMPEEINRVATDHISDLLLAPTVTAMTNLQHEGLGDRSANTGDVMYDAVLYYRDLALSRSEILDSLQLASRSYGVVTLHRAENTGPDELGRALELINRIAEKYLELVYPMHPRVRAALDRHAVSWEPNSRLRIVEPLGYLDMVRLMDGASLALTDSGGLQKEALFLDCPCVTLREETEWVETVTAGANTVVGLDAERAESAVASVLERFPQGESANFRESAVEHFGAGDAATRIVDEVCALVN